MKAPQPPAQGHAEIAWRRTARARRSCAHERDHRQSRRHRARWIQVRAARKRRARVEVSRRRRAQLEVQLEARRRRDLARAPTECTASTSKASADENGRMSYSVLQRGGTRELEGLSYLARGREPRRARSGGREEERCASARRCRARSCASRQGGRHRSEGASRFW